MAAAIGSTTRKIQRHDRECSTTPETAGPSAGATDIARVTLPITRPRSCSGTTAIRVVISSGIITAVPLAWTTRATSSTGKAGATRGEQGAGAEDAHRQAEGEPGGDALQEPAGHRDDHGHGQHERGGEPLGGVGVDVEVDHQARDRVDHDRLVEDHHEGGGDEPAQDPVVLGNIRASCGLHEFLVEKWSAGQPANSESQSAKGLDPRATDELIDATAHSRSLGVSVTGLLP